MLRNVARAARISRRRIGQDPMRYRRHGSMPGVTLRVVVLGVHGGGHHGGPGFPVQAESAVQLVADAESIFEVEEDERGRDVTGKAFDDDADLLHLGLDVIGRSESEVRIVRDGLRRHGGLLGLRRLRLPPGRQYVFRRAVARACRGVDLRPPRATRGR